MSPEALWPQGLATLTLRWDDGSEIVVTRVKVGPEDLELALDDAPLTSLDLVGSWPPPRVTKGRVKLDCEMTPDDDDLFYTLRQGT